MTDLTVLNQRVYPGAGDVDDCFVVATEWAYRASTANPTGMTTVPVFRKAAGKPDLPGPTGGNLDDIMLAVGKLWPALDVVGYKHPSWQGFMDAMREGRYASLAVLSSQLPSNLRFGFNGPHQVGVAMVAGVLLVANPLAKQGSAPIPISSVQLARAAAGLNNGWVMAALFPKESSVRNFELLYDDAGRVIAGSLTVHGADHYWLRLVDGAILGPARDGWAKQAIRVRLTEDITNKPHPGVDRRTGYLIGDNAAFFLESDVTFTPYPDRYGAGYDAAKVKATAAVGAI